MWGSRRLVAVALGIGALLLAGAGSAVGQPFSGNLFGGGGASEISYALTVSGVVSVSFHGDPRTGCAAHGLCGYSGLLTVRPGSQGELNVQRGSPSSGSIDFVAGGSGSGFTLADVVLMSGSRVVGQCVDAQQQGRGAPVDARNGSISLSALQATGASLSTRCAGPLDGDVARASRRSIVRFSRLRRPGARIDLSGTRTFAAGGFAGTVHSTIVVRVGPQNGSGSSSSSSTSFPPGIKTERIRTVSEALQVVSTSGPLGVSIRGASDPSECRLLDSCGLTGTLAAPFASPHAQGSLEAYGSAKRPYRDFLKALGLGSKGNARGIDVSGEISWSGGSFLETIDHGGRCSDRGPTGPGVVILQLGKHGLAATYTTDGTMRTRCPGPFFSTSTSSLTLARGRVGVSELRHRTFTLQLGGSAGFDDPGYSVVSHGHPSLVLRRGRLTQHVAVQPVG